MPYLSILRVYDNSAEVGPGEAVPDPILILDMMDSPLTYPPADYVDTLGRTPDWAKPLVEAALRTRSTPRAGHPGAS